MKMLKCEELKYRPTHVTESKKERKKEHWE
jgi:hypothetical protein